MNTATVSMAVTPTVLSTFLSHYLNRKPLKQLPTAHLSYDEGLHLIRSFLAFASHHTVEELQAFTAQWVPHPTWVKVDEVEIPGEKMDEAATAIQNQLGPDGIRQVGGRTWWQWRRPKSPLAAEWIEMRSDYHERKKSGGQGNRVMLYVHGGAYFFGSVDEHRYQMQRHARKLKARVFAPKYRLSPQFPFPCGLQDCLAAYLYLLTKQDPTTIILAGDSAGGGMVLSMLVTLRDRGLPLPAGAILISPWVDLTHSFPSVAGDCPFDYIPQHGFHHKPSKAWPPLNADESALLTEQVVKHGKLGHTRLMKPASVEMKRLSRDLSQLEDGEAVPGSHQPENSPSPSYLSINLDGQEITLKEQIQLYTTNDMLAHPLVSPIMQSTLGGLPPLLIMVGGGEILRDEQIYLAHKCANPGKYVLDDARMHKGERAQLARFKPTDVQLQVWDDLCHVAPTLSFTPPAKYMYRSIAQFGAWALARAQHTELEILDDDDISVISSNNDEPRAPTKEELKTSDPTHTPAVGKAGDELPPFKNHMIRQRVSRHGVITPLIPEADLPACNMNPTQVGVFKEGPVRKWLETRRQWDNRFGSTRAKIHKQRLKEMVAGYEGFYGETPPPSALASRRKKDYMHSDVKKRKSMGLALWSLWGSKHDEMAMNREQEASKAPEVNVTSTNEGTGARSTGDLRKQEQNIAKRNTLVRRSSRRRIVRDEQQTTEDHSAYEVTPLSVLMAKRTEDSKQGERDSDSRSNLPTPNHFPPETGVAGKRPIVEGIAVPFSLNREADTASMITLSSNMDGNLSRVASPRPMSPQSSVVAANTRLNADELRGPRPKTPVTAAADDMEVEEPITAGTPRKNITEPRTNQETSTTLSIGSPGATPTAEKANVIETIPSIMIGGMASPERRPPMETFVTAQDDQLPMVK